MQTRYDPYLQVDKGWDDSTEELVTEIFMLAGDASRTLSEMHYRIAILWSKEYGNTEGHTMRGYAKNRREVRPRSQERSTRL